ncbi:phosphotransferase enzyme family protein [Mesorhizobium sp. ArgA1]
MTNRGDAYAEVAAKTWDDDTRAFFSISASRNYFLAASKGLSTPPDPPKTLKLAELLLRHYGLKGEITALSSEAEFTAQVVTGDGQSLILKTSTRAKAQDSFRFQASVMATLQNADTFVVPTVIRTTEGGLTFEEADFCGYLQTKIRGRQLHSLGANADEYYQAGRALGHLDLALRPLDVPGKYRPVLWHIGCCSHLIQLQQYLPPGPIGEHVDSAMSDFCKIVEPQLAMVEWQITHNDPSPHNVFFADNKIAFIDFGDGTFGPRIQDLAIAASHLVTDSNRTLGGAEDLIAGYTSTCDLSTLERSLLVPLMRARQSALILVNHWRAHLFPADAQYIKKNVARAECGLNILAALAPEEAETCILDAIRGYH